MKNILITGGRSGIICDVIKRIKNDYNLYITVHTDSEVLAIRNIYRDYSNIKCFKLDIVNDNDIFKLDDINIDILICNGADIEGGSLLDMPFDKIRDNMEVNYFGNLKLIRRVISNNKSVKIIVISSLAGKMPLPFLGAYCSSKAALSVAIRSLRYELKLISKDLKVVIIEPGLYKTGFNKLGFDRKYEYMDNGSFFDEQIAFIKKRENIFLTLFERKNLSSISKKIVKAINEENPRLYYRAPFDQSLFIKFYNFFF